MGWKPEEIWNRLTIRQKWVLGGLGTYAGAWAFDVSANFAVDHVPSLLPLAALTTLFGSILVNRFILGLLGGAVLVGFGPNVWSWAKTQTRYDWFAGCASILFLIFLAGIGYMILHAILAR